MAPEAPFVLSPRPPVAVKLIIAVPVSSPILGLPGFPRLTLDLACDLVFTWVTGPSEEAVAVSILLFLPDRIAFQWSPKSLCPGRPVRDRWNASVGLANPSVVVVWSLCPPCDLTMSPGISCLGTPCCLGTDP
ncbi:hypothetical protein BTVI_30534 [Pitangus sulphuratus]|nr:hypothetical protein BTVI_30534 [Pitangus sulphuratus]